MKPKPNKFFFFWLTAICFLVFSNTTFLYSQIKQIDSLTSTLQNDITANFRDEVVLVRDSLLQTDSIDLNLSCNNEKEIYGEPSLEHVAQDSLYSVKKQARVLISDQEDHLKNLANQNIQKVLARNFELERIENIDSDNASFKLLNQSSRQTDFTKIDNIPVANGEGMLDSFSIDSAERLIENFTKINIEEFQELNGYDSQVKAAQNQIPQWDKSKVNSTEQMAGLLSENLEVINTGLQKMSEFKSKYSKLNLLNPNAPVMQEIEKRPEKPWQFSLNFSSQIQNGLSIQFAPTISYKILEKWIGGVAISYQNSITKKDSLISISPKHQLSHRVFNQVNFFKNFFIHLEHELPYQKNLDREQSEWYKLNPKQHKAWTGLAIQYNLYKNIKGQTQILYNIIKPVSVQESRWTIRVNLLF